MMDDHESAMPGAGTEHLVQETIDAGHEQENANNVPPPLPPAPSIQSAKKLTPAEIVSPYLRFLEVHLRNFLESEEWEKAGAIVDLMGKVNKMGSSPECLTFVDHGAVNHFVNLDKQLEEEDAKTLLHQLKV
jgi:hypothetical protein